MQLSDSVLFRLGIFGNRLQPHSEKHTDLFVRAKLHSMSPSLCAIAVSDIPAVVFFLDHQNQCWSSCNIASDQSSSMLRCHRFAGWKKPTDVVRVRVRD